MSKTNGTTSTAEAETEAQSPTDGEDSLLDDLDTLADTLNVSLEAAAEIRNRLNAAVQLARQALKQVNELEAEQEAALEAQQRRIDELERAVEDLRDDQRLLRQLGEAVATDRDTRAAVILQTLYRKADDNTESQRARITAREAWNAVGCVVDRSRMNDHLRYVAELVGDDDLCYYVDRPRGADPPSHLVLDLSAGHLPATLNGQQIKTGGGTDD